MRFLFALGLAAACSSPPPPPVSCTPANGSAAPLDGTFQVAGEVITITMRLSTFCSPEIAVRANVSVQDPNNQTMTLAEGEPTRDVTDRNQGSGMSTTVKVLAALPGAYHFTARFEPNLGLVQRDVLAAENHRDAGPDFVEQALAAAQAVKHRPPVSALPREILQQKRKQNERDGANSR